MLTVQPLVSNQKDEITIYKSLPERQQEAGVVIRKIAYSIFEYFDCVDSFNDDSIKNLEQFFDSKEKFVELVNLKPSASVLSFLNNLHSLSYTKVFCACMFKTDENSNLLHVTIQYFCMLITPLSLIQNNISLVYNGNFEIERIVYQRVNGVKGTDVDITKTKEMMCPLSEEFLFLELFLTEHTTVLTDAFPEWINHGTYTFKMPSIHSNMEVIRMLT